MSDRTDPQDRRRAALPAAERECQETLFEANLDSREKARRLFTHGLLREQEELLRTDASSRREARIQGILRRLEEPAPALEDLGGLVSQDFVTSHESSAPVSLREKRRNRFRLLVSAVAALLLASLGLFWLSSRGQNSLPELLAMARENHSRGLHIYRGYCETRRGKQSFDLALAEGGKAQIHAEMKHGSFDFGFTGKIGWFKTPVGKAVEVPVWDMAPLMEALPQNLKTLSPNLSYLEVEGLLSKILTKDGLRITGREKAQAGRHGKLVTLKGKYRVLGRAPRMYGRRVARSKGKPRTRRVYTGSVTIRISPDKGWIHDIRFKDDQRGAVTLLERVQSLPDAAQAQKPAWVEFEPEFTKSVPSLRMWRFVGYFMKKLKESARSKRQQNLTPIAPEKTREPTGPGAGK
jgi:hypothetical protein